MSIVISNYSLISDEITLKIFGYLPQTDRLAIAPVNKRWNRLVFVSIRECESHALQTLLKFFFHSGFQQKIEQIVDESASIKAAKTIRDLHKILLSQKSELISMVKRVSLYRLNKIKFLSEEEIVRSIFFHNFFSLVSIEKSVDRANKIVDIDKHSKMLIHLVRLLFKKGSYTHAVSAGRSIKQESVKESALFNLSLDLAEKKALSAMFLAMEDLCIKGISAVIRRYLSSGGSLKIAALEAFDEKKMELFSRNSSCFFGTRTGK